MQYISHYTSPIGEMLLAADDAGLTGAWFAGQKYYAKGLDAQAVETDLPLFTQARLWLDRYFAGENPAIDFPLHPVGSDFQSAVWTLLQEIPYGQTTTYGALARTMAAQMHLSSMSAQAVGGAVGRNPLSVFIPCHRVLGASGSLTGYAGGIDKKIYLLQLEGCIC